ncbi:SDR family NAD(P)-dependent oxidoreductase [Brevibacillus sp. H7]|uniref:SDR family NAD(P)-dependent oxidoreductase n=1 Tax=Brevibacillus sp. H7 TaxID=3349138 RepID=UPI0038286EE7
MVKKQDRVVIITGATGGLGQALARAHLLQGDQVAVTGRHLTKLEELKEMAASLGRSGHLHPYVLDVTDNEAVRAFAAWIHIRFERCDLLYNNAGTAVFKPFLETSLDEWEQTLATNVSGLLYVTRAFLPMMTKAGSGQIVNITSLAGQVATAKAAVYAASKAAVIRFSEGLRHELDGTGITVTCVMPGPIDTPFLDRADETGRYRHKVRRFLLTPEEAAKTIMRAVERKQPEVALPLRLHVLSAVYSLLPHGVKRWLAPLMNRK